MKNCFCFNLCLVLVGAAFAAPVELNGFLGTEIEYKPDTPTPLAGFTAARLNLQSQLSSGLKGVFGARLFPASHLSLYDWYDWYGDFSSWLPDFYPYAYVEADGALWEGAEPIKLTMGSIDVKYSPFVAWFGYDTRCFEKDTETGYNWYYDNVNGLTVDNIKLGTISARGFYAFYDPEEYNVLGVNFKGAFDDINLDATFVKLGEPVAYDISASLSPVKDLNLSGQFISDGVAEEGWYKFAVSYTGIPNWQLGAAYRDFSTLLVLQFRDTTPSVVDGSFVVPNPYDLNKDLEGMILNAATNYAGYNFSGEYDYALRTTAVTAAKDNWSAKLKLFYPREGEGFGDEVESLVVLRGKTTADVALLKNVEFEGVAELGKEAVYGGSATYKAPIGLKVVAEYYSDNLKDDDGLGWIQEKGLVIKAGFAVDF